MQAASRRPHFRRAPPRASCRSAFWQPRAAQLQRLPPRPGSVAIFFVLLLGVLFAPGCYQVLGSKDHYLHEQVSSGELVGIWKPTAASLEMLAAHSAEAPVDVRAAADSEIQIETDSRCRFRSYYGFRSDEDYIDATGKWAQTFASVFVHQAKAQRPAIALELEGPPDHFYKVELYLWRSNGRLILWQYFLDPDYPEYLNMNGSPRRLTSRRSGRASVASLPDRATISAMSSVSRHSARISAAHRRGRRAAMLSGSRAPLDSSVRRLAANMAISALLMLICVAEARASTTEIPSEEREVLEELFRATKPQYLAGLTSSDLWLHPCQWQGVVCQLSLAEPNRGRPPLRASYSVAIRLAGPLPQSVAQLRSLQELDLSQNDLTGDLPEELLRRWDDGTLKLDIRSSGLRPAVSRIVVSAVSTSVLCVANENVRWTLALEESGQAILQTVRCLEAEPYVLVRTGMFQATHRLSRLIENLKVCTWPERLPLSGATTGGRWVGVHLASRRPHSAAHRGRRAVFWQPRPTPAFGNESGKKREKNRIR